MSPTYKEGSENNGIPKIGVSVLLFGFSISKTIYIIVEKIKSFSLKPEFLKLNFDWYNKQNEISKIVN